MADSDKNILITPNRSQTAQPNIVFTGKGNIPITLKLLDDSTGTLSFEGSAGQLFSINNNLSTGTIFSVNDVSGIPMIDVDASGLVRLAPLGGTVYSNTLYGVPRTVAGSGNSVTIRAADGLTSGAGGSVILQPGQQATTGGDGAVVIRQPGGTPGTNECQIFNTGLDTYFRTGTNANGGFYYFQRGDGQTMFHATAGQGGQSRYIVCDNFMPASYNVTIGDQSNGVNLANGKILGFRNAGYAWTEGYTAGLSFATPGVIQVGRYNSSVSLTNGGSFAYPASTPTTLAASTNDLVLNGSAFQRLSSSAAYNLTGIAPPSTGAHVDGRVIWLHNVGSFNITLKHDATSIAENRFVTETAGDFILGPRRAVQCTYDTATARWRVIGAVNYPYSFPTTDGTSGQVLSTNGSGTLSWANASSGTGTVTSVSGTGTVNGITLTGTVTSTGNLTLGGSLSNVSLTSQVTGTLPIANGGTNATTALTANNNIVSWGHLTGHSAYTDFNTAQKWGVTFIQSTTNGPGVNSASQYYSLALSLGSEYSWGSGQVYGMQMAIPRNVTSPYVTIRYKEGGADTAGWGSWQKISAGYADTAGSATSATSATTATNATNVAVTADSTNATRYLTFVGATSGNNGALANAALTYNPSTGNFGIGTATTNNKLHVYTATGSVGMALQTGSSSYAYFVNNGTDGILASNVGSTGQKIRYNLGTPDDAVYVSSTGAMGLGQTSPGAKLHVETGAAGTKGLIVKAAANPTANLLEVQNSSGTNLVYVDSSGDLAVGVPNATYFPSGAAAPLHVTRATTAVATAIAAWPTYEPDTQTHARVTAFFTDGGNGGTATVSTGTTTIIKFGEYYTGRVVLMPEGAGGQTPADQNSGAGRDIMLLGGKSDNTAGKTGGRVFIQGGTGYAGAYGSNFGNVVLQPNGGDVGIGTSSPATKLHVVGAIRSSGYTGGGDGTYLALTGDLPGYPANRYPTLRSDGSIYFSVANRYAAYLSSADNSFGILNTSTQSRVQLHPNGTSYFTGGAVAFGATTAAGGGQVYIAPQASGTKGLVVRGAASQSANLQEWQDNTGSARSWISSACKLNVLQAGDGAQGGLEESVANFGHKSFWSNADAGLISVGFTDIAGTYNSSSARWDMYFKTGNSGDPSARTERLRILGSNGNVGIGTKVPDKLLTVAGNAATAQITLYKSPDGSINSAQQIAVLGTGSSNTNSGTTGGNEYGLLQLFHNGTVRCQIYAGGNGWILDGMSFGSNSAPAGQVYITPTSNATKGLVVRGAASQSANLQEWQNNGGTALAVVDANGNISGANYSSTTASSTTLLQTYVKEYSYSRAAPTTVGNYVELCDYNEVTGFMEITVASEAGNGIGHTIKRYHLAAVFAQTRNVIICPISMDRQGGYTSTFDFELESASITSYTNRLRIRRTAGTSARNLLVTVKLYSPFAHSLTEQSGTGTSSIGNSFWNSLIGTYLSVPPVVGGSGAGNSLTLYAGSGETSGAGGSIILQPGAQATTGGNGSIRFINPSNTAQYFTIAPSTSALDFSLTGISNDVNTGGINFNGINIRGLGTVNTAALFAGSFYAQGSTLRATNGTSVQIGSSNGTSTDNINYIWMRQDGHIAWYGDIGLRRDGVGVLSVTNGSTGGGSLAYKSNTTNISTATNNLVLNGSAFQRLNCTAACNLTGVAPPSGSHIDGRMMRIYNVGTANLTLKHNSTSSDVANRFCCVQAVDIILAPRDYAELIYDGTDGGLVAGQNNPCWRVA